jgi:hypothetical protein
MSVSSRAPFVLSSLLGLTVAATASADPAGDKVLASMDEAMNRSSTQSIEYDVVNQEPGKAERRLGLLVKLKGEKRLTEFLAPADMKGTKVLILSPTQMYVYLPAFGKIRRIASHVTDQGFLGLAFSQDDLATTRYTPSYSAVITSETPAQWKLTATPKPDQKTAYAKIEMTVDKASVLPSELRYFNDKGVHLKTETRADYGCEGKVCTPKDHKMVDHQKGGHFTRLLRKTWKVNEPIPDEIFSKRSLEK